MKKVVQIFLFSGLLSFSLLSACTTPGEKTAYGAGIGAAAGAVVGAVVGHQTGNRGKGAMIGALVGGSAGGAIGNRMDKQAKELAAVAETRRTEDGIVTKLKGDILFPSGKAILKSKAKSNIKQISGILKKYPENRIVIMGHSDSTGSDSINQKLSKERADAVKSVMISGGVVADIVTSIGMGESQPVASNKTASGRSQNRRVEIKITQVETDKKSSKN